MSKQRPRANFKGGFMHNNPKYHQWLLDAKQSFIEQWEGKEPLEKVAECSIKMYGANSSSDVDNLVGSVLDALVKAQVIKNDNIGTLSDLHIVHQKSKTPRVEVYLETTDYKALETQWSQGKRSGQIKGVTIE